MAKDLPSLGATLLSILNKKCENKAASSLSTSGSVTVGSPSVPLSSSSHLTLNVTVTVSSRNLHIQDIDPVEFAHQLTLTEYELYNKIRPKECLGQRWNKEGKEKKAPNIVALIDRFNKMSRWVVTEIVKESNVQGRANLIRHFIAIAGECRELQNYNSMMSIVSGLMGAAVSRLKKTWQLLVPDVVEKFEKTFGAMFPRNYAMLRGAVKQAAPPCLPYIGVYLSDLTFIEEGNLDTIADGKLINFEKLLMISRVITDLRVYQDKCYSFVPVPILRDFLTATLEFSPILDSETAYNLSILCEPRLRDK